MGGVRHRSLHVEVKDGFGAAGAFHGQPPPTGIPHPRRAIPGESIPHEIDIGVVCVGRPVAVEVVEEVLPIGWQAINLKISKGEREGVVDADQRRHLVVQTRQQPFGDALERPVFARPQPGVNGVQSTQSSPDSGGVVNINRASATELDALPGVGPSTAQAIVDYRTTNGPFGSPEDLLNVRGIGPAKFDAMRKLVGV